MNNYGKGGHRFTLYGSVWIFLFCFWPSLLTASAFESYFAGVDYLTAAQMIKGKSVGLDSFGMGSFGSLTEGPDNWQNQQWFNPDFHGNAGEQSLLWCLFTGCFLRQANPDSENNPSQGLASIKANSAYYARCSRTLMPTWNLAKEVSDIPEHCDIYLLPGEYPLHEAVVLKKGQVLIGLSGKKSEVNSSVLKYLIRSNSVKKNSDGFYYLALDRLSRVSHSQEPATLLLTPEFPNHWLLQLSSQTLLQNLILRPCVSGKCVHAAVSEIPQVMFEQVVLDLSFVSPEEYEEELTENDMDSDPPPKNGQLPPDSNDEEESGSESNGGSDDDSEGGEYEGGGEDDENSWSDSSDDPDEEDLYGIDLVESLYQLLLNPQTRLLYLRTLARWLDQSKNFYYRRQLNLLLSNWFDLALDDYEMSVLEVLGRVLSVEFIYLSDVKLRELLVHIFGYAKVNLAAEIDMHFRLSHPDLVIQWIKTDGGIHTFPSFPMIRRLASSSSSQSWSSFSSSVSSSNQPVAAKPKNSRRLTSQPETEINLESLASMIVRSQNGVQLLVELMKIIGTGDRQREVRLLRLLKSLWVGVRAETLSEFITYHYDLLSDLMLDEQALINLLTHIFKETKTYLDANIDIHFNKAWVIDWFEIGDEVYTLPTLPVAGRLLSSGPSHGYSRSGQVQAAKPKNIRSQSPQNGVAVDLDSLVSVIMQSQDGIHRLAELIRAICADEMHLEEGLLRILRSLLVGVRARTLGQFLSQQYDLLQALMTNEQLLADLVFNLLRLVSPDEQSVAVQQVFNQEPMVSSHPDRVLNSDEDTDTEVETEGNVHRNPLSPNVASPVERLIPLPIPAIYQRLLRTPRQYLVAFKNLLLFQKKSKSERVIRLVMKDMRARYQSLQTIYDFHIARNFFSISYRTSWMRVLSPYLNSMDKVQEFTLLLRVALESLGDYRWYQVTNILDTDDHQELMEWLFNWLGGELSGRMQESIALALGYFLSESDFDLATMHMQEAINEIDTQHRFELVSNPLQTGQNSPPPPSYDQIMGYSNRYEDTALPWPQQANRVQGRTGSAHSVRAGQPTLNPYIPQVQFLLPPTLGTRMVPVQYGYQLPSVVPFYHAAPQSKFALNRAPVEDDLKFMIEPFRKFEDVSTDPSVIESDTPADPDDEQ